ncbi:ABC transporter ATP-binding protein/permease [Rhodoplanes azumiensis]|uniref:ABC transporter ATP-binding protein/permease n=1 Tax=Rhodoplanes azumiensis TaxID=1897628 RepID=A0ABW5AKJ9_9BRAD
MSRLTSSLAVVWRLAAPYFRSEDRWAGRGLLAAVIVIELAIVAITVMINQWNNRFYNALQERSWDAFVSELLFFCALAAAYIVLAVYQLYLNQWLQIRWRRWMTGQYLSQWLAHGNHYRMQLLGDAADNPDQRIAEDINQFIDRGLTIGLGLLNAVVTLVSFVAILWGLSAQAPLHLGGRIWDIPGYLVWAALLWAIVGTALTHLIGRPLIPLNFRQQRYEADFRFSLVRVRENGEQIALLGGESAEKARLLDRFGALMGNWFAIMTRQKKLTFFTAGYGQVSTVFPFVVVSPAYFAGAVNLGGLMQTASAFGSVQTALSFFITSYRSIAEWKAVVDRLDGFDAAIAAGRAATQAPETVAVTRRPDADAIAATALDVRLPNGRSLVTAADFELPAGARVLVAGPSGSGKSTLFRALAGIWPFGDGDIAVPADKSVMVLPQKPYLPIGPLAAAVCYPALPDAFSRERIGAVLTSVGLGALVPRLDEDAHWARMLSLGEQQRLAIARAVLHAPDYLFLDEATASLDEPSEAALYRLLREALPGTALISIGHRSTLDALHERRLVLERDGDRHTIRERDPAPAP